MRSYRPRPPPISASIQERRPAAAVTVHMISFRIRLAFTVLTVVAVALPTALVHADRYETTPPIGIDERIEFAPGTDSATIEDGVVLGTTNRYHLRAAAGQTMAIALESVEANAVFSVFAPDQTLISNPGVTTFAGTLPTSGDYLVEVATVRGNATYRMDVQIVGPFPVTPSPVGVERRVEFEPGTDHGFVGGAIVLGTADRFVLRASAGQSMSISVVSLEDNAVVRVYGPEGGELPGGGGDWFSGTLPADGDYIVEVTSVHGNATYASDHPDHRAHWPDRLRRIGGAHRIRPRHQRRLSRWSSLRWRGRPVHTRCVSGTNNGRPSRLRRGQCKLCGDGARRRIARRRSARRHRVLAGGRRLCHRRRRYCWGAGDLRDDGLDRLTPSR